MAASRVSSTARPAAVHHPFEISVFLFTGSTLENLFSATSPGALEVVGVESEALVEVGMANANVADATPTARKSLFRQRGSRERRRKPNLFLMFLSFTILRSYHSRMELQDISR